jgi:hypothetical protein
MSASGHAIFVAINAIEAYGMLRRPRWFIPFFAVMVVQQLYSHGSWALDAYRLGRPDWRSWMVLLTMPAMLLLLVYDARAKPLAAATPAAAK